MSVCVYVCVVFFTIFFLWFCTDFVTFWLALFKYYTGISSCVRWYPDIYIYIYCPAAVLVFRAGRHVHTSRGAHRIRRSAIAEDIQFLMAIIEK